MQDGENCNIGYFIFPGRGYMSSFPDKLVHLLPLIECTQCYCVALTDIPSPKIFPSVADSYWTKKLRMELNFKLLVKCKILKILL